MKHITPLETYKLNESSNLSKHKVDDKIISYLHSEFNIPYNENVIDCKSIKEIYENNLILTFDDKIFRILFIKDGKIYISVFKYENNTWNFKNTNVVNDKDLHKLELNEMFKIKNYDVSGRVERKKLKRVREYNDFFENFKIDILKKIIEHADKKIKNTENKSYDKILDNLSDYSNMNLQELAKNVRSSMVIAKELNYDAKMIKQKISSYNNSTVMDNTLDALNHAIIKYEVLASEDLDDFVTVKDISDMFGYETLIRSFISFIITRRINFIVKKKDEIEYDF